MQQIFIIFRVAAILVLDGKLNCAMMELQKTTYKKAESGFPPLRTPFAVLPRKTQDQSRGHQEDQQVQCGIHYTITSSQASSSAFSFMLV